MKNIRQQTIRFIILIMGIVFLLYSFFDVQSVVNPIRVGLVVLIMLLYLQKRVVKRSVILWMLLCAYFITAGSSIALNVAYLFAFGFLLADLGEQELYRWINSTNLMIFIIVLLSLIFGIEENIIWSYQGRTRYSFGFEHANFVGMFLFSAGAVWLLSRQQVTWKHCLAVLGITYILFLYTNSRTGFIGTIIMVVLIILLQYLPVKYVNWLAVISESFFFISPFLWKLELFNNDFTNKLFSLRPRLFATYIDLNSGWNFVFGGSTAWETDNAYLLILYSCGVVFYGLFAFCTIKTTLNLLSANEKRKVAFILATLSLCLMESAILRPELLCMPVFWSMVFCGGFSGGEPFPQTPEHRVFLQGTPEPQRILKQQHFH